MNLKTVDALSDKLDYEMSWRRIELTNIKFNVENVEGTVLNTNLRSSLVLLYAHWEGFVKKALTYYLEHVSKQKLPNNQLKHNFYALEIHSDMQLFNETNKNKLHTKIIDSILGNMAKESSIPYKNKIDTKSNLKSELFKELMFTVGLDSSQYETYFRLIDERLLGTRNQIAHGEELKQLQLTKDSYLELHKKMTELMDALKEQIINAAMNKLYMVTPLENATVEEISSDIQAMNDSIDIVEDKKVLVPV